MVAGLVDMGILTVCKDCCHVLECLEFIRIREQHVRTDEEMYEMSV